MIAKYLSFIAFSLLVRTIGWDDCDANFQFQEKLREAILERRKQEDGTFTENKSYF